MKILSNPDLFKVSALLFISFIFFYLGRHWSDGYRQLVFFSSSSTDNQTGGVGISPNFNKSFDVSSLIGNETDSSQLPLSPPPTPPPPPEIKRFGIVNENGTMSDDFVIGEYDAGLEETSWKNESATVEEGSGGERKKIAVEKFEICPESMREYIPCLDNVEAIKRLKSTDKGERFERHCPENGTGLDCLVPAPKGYKTPLPWPRSRDEVCLCL